MNKETKNYIRRLKALKKSAGIIGGKKDANYSLPQFETDNLTYKQKMDLFNKYIRIEKHCGKRFIRKQKRHRLKMAMLAKLAKLIRAN